MRREPFSYVYDGIDLSPAAKNRPKRTSTESIVLHKIGADRLRWVMHEQKDIPSAELYEMSDVEVITAFFTRSPEGVAAVTLGGSRKSKLRTIHKWRRRGVPKYMRDRAYVPYELVIDRAVDVTRFLPTETQGAHAVGYNRTGMGVAIVGDFEQHKPTEAQVRMAQILVADHCAIYPDAEVLGHDDTLVMRGKKPKGCPGRYFPIKEIAGLAGVS